MSLRHDIKLKKQGVLVASQVPVLVLYGGLRCHESSEKSGFYFSKSMLTIAVSTGLMARFNIQELPAIATGHRQGSICYFKAVSRTEMEMPHKALFHF